MRALIVTIILLVLLGLVPIALDVSWEQKRFSLFAGLGPFKLMIGSPGKKRRGPDRSRHGSGGEKGAKRLSPGLLKILAKNGYDILCRAVTHLRVDILRIHFTSAFSDPAVTAMAYGAAGTAMEALLCLGKNRIAHPDMRADVDFDGKSPELSFRIRLSLRVYRLLGLGVRFGVGFLREYIPYKRRMKNDGQSSDRRHDGGGDGKDPHDDRFEYGRRRACHNA